MRYNLTISIFVAAVLPLLDSLVCHTVKVTIIAISDFFNAVSTLQLLDVSSALFGYRLPAAL